MSLFVSCEDASFGYEGRPVISGLNWTAEEGDYLCITGENGSGKSTLIKGLFRLITPITGRVIFSDKRKKAALSGAGYLSQSLPANKNFPAGVMEIVLSGKLSGTGLRPFYSRAEKEDAVRQMKNLDVYDLKDRCFGELSGGQQRRVLIARALCASNKALVLDEPASGLDPIAAADVYALLKRLNQDFGMTIIMVTHDIEAAVRYANKILNLQNRQLFFGSIAEYISSDIGKHFLYINKGSHK
jgi:zinc transport system ATP-binding protein